ncbi:Complement C1q-like protein 4 [Mactra antiquata]
MNLLLFFVVTIFSQSYGNEVSELRERVQNLESIVNAMVVKLETCNCQETAVVNKRQVTEGPVAFTAAVSPRSIDHMTDGQSVVFDTTITDIGGGYDNKTGIYVVPLTGLYMFQCSLLDHMAGAHGTSKLHAEIVKNGNMLVRVFAHSEDTYRDQGSNLVFIPANKGDQIWVRVVDNGDLGLGGQFYSTFSGTMMWQS